MPGLLEGIRVIDFGRFIAGRSIRISIEGISECPSSGLCPMRQLVPIATAGRQLPINAEQGMDGDAKRGAWTRHHCGSSLHRAQ